MPTLAQTQVVTPTALYTPIPLSEEDNEVYQKALIDIPIYRQGDLRLSLVDESDAPLSGYQIKYRQTSHDFLFGGVIEPFRIMSLKKVGFNTMTVYLDWRFIEAELGKFTLDFINYWTGIDEFKSGGIRVKTNSLFGMSEEDMQPFFNNVPYDEFLVRLYDYVATTVKRFAPSVDFWEAILEPNFGNHNPLNLSKDQYYQAISTSIRAIRDNDPTATIEINLSYPCEGSGWANMFELVQEMLNRKIDFDVLGLQLYYNSYALEGDVHPKIPLSQLSACFDRYEKILSPYGKRVVGSEFSVPSEVKAGYWNQPWSEDTQAQYLTTAYTIFFSKPSNMGLIWWDTIEPTAAIYHGGLVREDGTPKKSYYALQNLVKGWTTSGEGITDKDGNFTFRGYGGDYDLEIVDPVKGESMTTQVHITEQKAANQSIMFIPNNLLNQQKAKLEKLVAYWESTPDQEKVQKGHDYVALVNHHMQNSEWALAEQTLSAAFNELVISSEVVIPVDQLIPAGNPESRLIIEHGSNLIWGSTTLHFPYDFPAGVVTAEITSHAHNEKGESPLMVIGIGANYSQVWRVKDEQPEIHTFATLTTGDEQELTIRFPYDGDIYKRINDQIGDVGELKLFIDKVKLTITTTEIP